MYVHAYVWYIPLYIYRIYCALCDAFAILLGSLLWRIVFCALSSSYFLLLLLYRRQQQQTASASAAHVLDSLIFAKLTQRLLGRGVVETEEEDDDEEEGRQEMNIDAAVDELTEV